MHACVFAHSTCGNAQWRYMYPNTVAIGLYIRVMAGSKHKHMAHMYMNMDIQVFQKFELGGKSPFP